MLLAWKDGRNYLHSTTLLECVVATFSEAVRKDPETRLDARFRQLIRGPGRFLPAAGANAAEAAAEFRVESGGKAEHSYFMLDASLPPLAAKTQSAVALQNFSLQGEYTGWAIAHFHSHEAFWENVIEFLKRLQLSAAAPWGQPGVMVLAKALRGVPIGNVLQLRSEARLSARPLTVNMLSDRLQITYMVLVDDHIAFEADYVTLLQPR